MARPHRTRTFEIEASLPSSASPQLVMRRVRSPKTWPDWQTEIVSAAGPDPLSAGDVVDGEARLLGFDVMGRSTTLSSTDERFEEDVIVGVRMRISYSVAGRGAGSIITHRMEADLPAGWTGSLLSFFLARRLRRMQKDLLKALSDQSRDVQEEGARS